MARQTAINTADDMRWLREVHLPRLPAKYKSAIIVGNEDYPDRIEVYERRDPVVTDVPLVFEADEEGAFRETKQPSPKRHHATKKSAAQLEREIAEVLGQFPYADPQIQEKWRVEPSELHVGMRFDYFGKPYEITKIGRDKAKTVQIARRYRDPFGKEDLIDHRSFPMRAFYQQHLRPLRG